MKPTILKINAVIVALFGWLAVLAFLGMFVVAVVAIFKAHLAWWILALGCAIFVSMVCISLALYAEHGAGRGLAGIA